MVIRYALDTFVFREDENDIKRFLLSTFALPMLPVDMIEPTFQQLVQSLTNNSANILSGFIQNYGTVWLRHVTARNFSVYENIDLLTDIFENYGNQLHAKIGTFPVPWKFTGEIYKKMLS